MTLIELRKKERKEILVEIAELENRYRSEKNKLERESIGASIQILDNSLIYIQTKRWEKIRLSEGDCER